MPEDVTYMSFYIDVPATYPECHTCRSMHGVPTTNDEEDKLRACAEFAADRIEHTLKKRIDSEMEFVFSEINIHAQDMGIKCSYDEHGGPSGRGAIVLGIE